MFYLHSAFAVSMCNKLSDMVECESTAADRRAKLVRALRTVHGGGNELFIPLLNRLHYEITNTYNKQLGTTILVLKYP